jgi:magnesium chelatase subunit I
VEALASMPVLKAPVMRLAGSETPAAVASATEFVLEGLHLSKRLNKEAVGGRATYRGR